MFCVPALAYDLDTSVNSQIEQKYDSNKLNKDMKVNQTSTNTNSKPPKTTPVFDNSTPIITKVSNTISNITTPKTGTKIPSGTKFSVKSNIAAITPVTVTKTRMKP